MTRAMPNIRNTIKANGITYNVMAYRELSRQELIMSVRHYRATTKKKPKAGDIVDIISIIDFSR
jgi:hypothetical protein